MTGLRLDRFKLGEHFYVRTHSGNFPSSSFSLGKEFQAGILSVSVLEYTLFGFRQSRESGNQTRLSFREASPGLGSKLALDWPGGPSFGNCATEW